MPARNVAVIVPETSNEFVTRLSLLFVPDTIRSPATVCVPPTATSPLRYKSCHLNNGAPKS